MPQRYIQYDLLDVFATDAGPYSGNPLAVFHDGQDLSTAQCQTLARELNLSEVTFPSNVQASSYDVRIFTPGQELPFAGHPTLGTCSALLKAAKLSRPAKDAVLQQSSRSGITRLAVAAEDEQSVTVAMTAKASLITGRLPVNAQLAKTAFNLANAPIALRRAGCGLNWLCMHVPVHELASIIVDTKQLGAWSEDVKASADAQDVVGNWLSGCAVFALEDTIEGQVSLKVRVFFVEHGNVIEDPATGSAALALGLVLHAEGHLASISQGGKYSIDQGAAIGKPSRLDGHYNEDGTVTVQGKSIVVGRGQLLIPNAN
ncbi:uncharacterized protein L969DRAFT_42194 [Mixia osmundae IAM 14324]|uniref:Uncharacterized protein n=1 Tax=Mixia osmundae (strain CBS 9802 / IAM 14324 / JCM 22182 / KY 12970) TaxID=764103 RepID=G7E3X8_MIXOS|nr:uncharacterized protein L969DRAFT_42194 [Mixia osmundae IAM 14324]KEI41983.1 hypothetical protein L969DRAFT_42194 [Mixia osmundae IAM 14324]GAA97538.1 hypothetical protein E5Q_04216 [Mixia osmundae IAM 14324]